MAGSPFMTVRRGATFRFVEQASGDTSPISQAPTGTIVKAHDLREEPATGATPVALTVQSEPESSRWVFEMANTSALTPGRYLVNTRYVLDDGSIFIAEPSLLIVKP